MYFLIVSGMSGAGKSRAVATLEDLGYYCVDNLPISLIPRFAEICLALWDGIPRRLPDSPKTRGARHLLGNTA